MLKNRSTKLLCLLIAFVWTTILIGSSYAYFIDSVEVTGNVIAAGNLKAGLDYMDKSDGQWKDASRATIFNYQRWEPGYTDVQYICMSNKGDLALQYELNLVPDVQTALMDVIDVYFGEVEAGYSIQDRATFWKQVEDGKLSKVGSMRDLLNNSSNPHGLNGADAGVLLKGESKTACIVLHMQEEAGNEYQNLSVGEGFKLQMYATQYMYETDSFGKDYDEGAKSELPELKIPTSMTIQVQPVNGRVPVAVVFDDPVNGVSATVPAGAKMVDGATSLTLIVSPMDNSEADISEDKNEVRISYNVKVEGLATDNTVPAIINMGEVLPKGLNMGNYTLYHVENGNTVKMNHVDTPAAHNDFAYNPATGEVTVAMATFSEVTLVSDKEAKWEGNYDYSWYSPNARSADYTIANADQLAAFGAIVGGMNGQTQDSFAGKTVKLISDINLGDDEEHNNSKLIFYPIGYYNSEGTYERTNTAITSGLRNFEGTFDGNGHTIANFYQNTWEMKGDNNYYDASLQYYRDGMGLFGKVYGGTVKNLTVDHFSSDGEYTTTGVIAAYADCGANFENIAITDCTPRVYNIGNGGIVGCVGWYAKEADLKTTFTNITVDNSNKISALWGSWDVACGGIVGQYYPTSGQTSAGSPKNAGIHFENCHVSAQIDVYNDVCANYQYYAYRYAGMMIGSVRENETIDGRVYPKMAGITASGCTVNFGDWNDYYYCELVANSLASYTHDHQMSRLVQIDEAPDTSNMTVKINGKTVDIPTSGAANYVVVTKKNENRYIHATANAECYHFVAGKAWNHDDAGTETVNGVEGVPKEDKQHIYLEFNQLFTGYGWGVTSVGITELDGILVSGVTVDEGKIEASDEKFVKASGAKTEYTTGTIVNIGDLFAAKSESAVAIKPEQVVVFVSPANDDLTSNASATYTPASPWTEGTLEFHGKGKAAVTITDYYFCTPTTIEVTIKAPDMLYRVGNKNDVTNAQIAKLLTGTENYSSISIERYQGDVSRSGSEFTGTGIVSVKIDKAQYYLEVIDAYNVTAYSGLKNQTSVLLNNITMSSNSAYYLSGNNTLYGNNFVFDCTNGAYKASGSVSENYVVALNDAHLDNVQIVGKVYTQYGATASSDYNRALVVSKGNSTITNCYLSNTASPVRLVEGSLEVKGSTLKGGNFANIDIRNGYLTIEDVTTINQALGNDKVDGTTVIGLGIVVYYEHVDTAQTSITIKGTLKQYNHVSTNDTFTNDYAKQFVNQMLTGNYTAYQLKIGDVTWVNTGIISMTSGVNLTGSVTGYTKKDVRFMSRDGYAYTAMPTEGDVQANSPVYGSVGQGNIAPSFSFDYTNKNYVEKKDGSNDYCYYENGKVLISMDQGDTFDWDPFILTAKKYGQSLDYTVKMNGKTYASGSKIPFNTAGDYTVTYSYTDNNNYGKLDANGNLIRESETYEKTVSINVAVVEQTTKHAEFTFSTDNIATEKITVNNKTYISAKGKSAEEKKWGYITVNGTKIFYPIINAEMKRSGSEVQVFYYVFKNAVTITDYEDGLVDKPFNYTEATPEMPSSLTVVNGMEAKYNDISSACVDISKLTKDGPSGEVWDFSASSMKKDTVIFDNCLAHQSPPGLKQNNSTRNYNAITVAQFSYQDEAGATYYYFVGYYMDRKASSSGSVAGGGGCVAPETLVTLANGTQVRVDSLTGNEKLLVWNMETGMLDEAAIIFVDNDPKEEYEIVHLYFSDGTDVKVIYEHGFWDYNLNKYVYLDKDAKQYIGHTFAKHNGSELSKVKLTDVVIEKAVTTAWSPVTADHLCYFVNGMLSMPGGVGGLFNIFDVNPATMAYDMDALARDIETYGLFTYEELNAIVELPEEMFNAAGGAYLKVSIGKGNLTMNELVYMIERYTKYFK